MSFMEPETYKGAMWGVDSAHGIELVPCDLIGDTLTGDTLAKATALRDYITPQPADVWSVKLVRGWFARLSAPGYLDATEWSGPFRSERAALRFLREMYGEDE